MQPFQIGDKVVVVKERAAYKTGKGTIGIITAIFRSLKDPEYYEYEIQCISYRDKEGSCPYQPEEYYIYQPHDCVELYDVIIPKQQQVINKIKEMYERRNFL